MPQALDPTEKENLHPFFKGIDLGLDAYYEATSPVEISSVLSVDSEGCKGEEDDGFDIEVEPII